MRKTSRIYIIISEMTEVKSSPAVEKMKSSLIIYVRVIVYMLSEHSSSIQTLMPSFLTHLATDPSATPLSWVKRQGAGKAASRICMPAATPLRVSTGIKHAEACTCLAFSATYTFLQIAHHVPVSSSHSASFVHLTHCCYLSVLCRQ